MILFENNIFYLNTKNTTYALGVFNDGILAHLYWGKRIYTQFCEEDIFCFDHRHMAALDCDDKSTDYLPLEYSPQGGADLRITGLGGVHNDGSNLTVLRYKGYEIINGKSVLEGLPATYAENGDNVQTLVIKLRDDLKNLDVYLNYSVFEDLDAVTRSVKIVNNGEKFRLSNVFSATVDFYGLPKSDIIHLDGCWARERTVTRREIVHGNQNIESRTGASSAYHNPFIAVCDKETTENNGDAYGFSLVYSGNFTAGIEMDAYNCARAYIGINPYKFEFVLENGDSFQTPEAVLVYSADGLSGMSRIYHKLYRTRLCRGKYRDIDRFVLINNWEATYFDFNEEKIVDIAKKASEIGVDTMVLDDGWFAGRLNERAGGLGDWIVNEDRLPNGLNSLAKRINELGLHFGLWFEPEMVNPVSRLYETHPEWIIHTKGRKQSLSRYQYTLDLSNKEVCDYIIGAVSRVLKSANIEYVKWDMNRYMSEVGSAFLSSDRQGELMHRYILGLYYILETLVTEFPNILFESCSSGGGRFDPGMLYYMPQTWTSDNTDALDRIKIQYGTSFVYPFSAMGAHVSACPNHQVWRTTPFSMRCNVALPGQFGFELDLNKCTEKELETAKQAVIRYKELRQIFHKGDCYRLRSPFTTDWSALEFVSEDKNTVILCFYSKAATAMAPDEYIKLYGLDEKSKYDLDGKIFGGDYLMGRGYRVRNNSEYANKILVFKKIN